MQRRGAKSFVDDLGLGRGVVLSRAAASLRSIETKPFDWRFVRFGRTYLPLAQSSRVYLYKTVLNSPFSGRVVGRLIFLYFS